MEPMPSTTASHIVLDAIRRIEIEEIGKPNMELLRCPDILLDDGTAGVLPVRKLASGGKRRVQALSKFGIAYPLVYLR